MNLIKINRMMISAYNECSYEEFMKAIDTLLELPDPERFFTQKRYLWSWLRARDFYKSIARYITNIFCEPDSTNCIMEHADFLIKIILKTTPSEKIRQSFIWNIMKKCPLLTVDTIQYASTEKIHSLITSNKPIIADDAIKPFLSEIASLKSEIQAYKLMLESEQ